MNSRTVVLLASLVSLLGVSPAADAGGFMWFRGDELVSSPPTRVRIRFGVVPAHLIGSPFCGLKVFPGTYLGSTIRPVLSCDAPPGISCSVDSVGDAVFVVDPCRPSWGGVVADSLTLVVDGLPAYFDAQYMTTGWTIRDGDFMYVPADSTLPVRTASWGEVKGRFR
jgi:hypothetical protein